jgi:hypothetical protein
LFAIEVTRMSDINRRGLPRPAKTSKLGAGTSLTPYGMSFWAMILAACGGGGGGGGGDPTTTGTGETPAPAELSSTVSRSGHVYDGPVKGARVYVDEKHVITPNSALTHFG